MPVPNNEPAAQNNESDLLEEYLMQHFNMSIDNFLYMEEID